MNLFRKNKPFNPKFVHQKKDKEVSNTNIKLKWEALKATQKRKTGILYSPLFIAIILLIVLIGMYVLGQYE